MFVLYTATCSGTSAVFSERSSVYGYDASDAHACRQQVYTDWGVGTGERGLDKAALSNRATVFHKWQDEMGLTEWPTYPMWDLHKDNLVKIKCKEQASFNP